MAKKDRSIVRSQVVATLYSLDCGSAVIITAIEDVSPDVRMSAARGLGYTKRTDAAPQIAKVMAAEVGSVTISAITSAGILAPVAPILGLDPVLLALAAGAGSLFAVHVTSNTFWLLQSLLGQSTRGTLKTCTVGVSVASVVAILLILPASVLF